VETSRDFFIFFFFVVVGVVRGCDAVDNNNTTTQTQNENTPPREMMRRPHGRFFAATLAQPLFRPFCGGGELLRVPCVCAFASFFFIGEIQRDTNASFF
jgi:hypothetical protein